jgi:hypothetical protein
MRERKFSMQRRRVDIRLLCLQRLTWRRGRTRKARYSRDKCTDHPRSWITEDCVVEVVGLKLVTHHPVIEPVSEIRVGNGIFRCRDGGSRSVFFVCRDWRGDENKLEKPAIRGTNAPITRGVRYLTTGWWWVQSAANPSPCYLPENRVVFEENTERMIEQSQQLRKTGHFLHFC